MRVTIDGDALDGVDAASALSGTPHNQDPASANTIQSVTFQGAGFTESSTKVVLEAMNRSGVPYITTITPDTTKLTFEANWIDGVP